MTKLIPLAVALSSVVFPAAPVAAQVAAAASTPVSGLRFNALGEITYDTNALRISDSAPLALGETSKDDIRYSPAINAQYVRAVGRTVLTVDGLAGRDFYQNNKYLNRNRFAGGGSLSYRAASCSAVVNGNYSSRQNGTRDFGNVVPAVGVPIPDDIGRLTDNRQIEVVYGLNVSCGGNGRLSFGGGAQRSELRNAGVTRRFGDSDSNVYSLFAGIGVLRPGQLRINGSYSTINYPNLLTTPGLALPPFALNNSVKTYSVGLSYTRPIGTKLTGTIGASYLTSRPDGPQAPYSSPAYNINLIYVPSNRLTLSIAGSRSAIASQTAGALFRVVDSIDVSASYRLGEKIFTTANAGLISNSYNQPFATVGQPARQHDSSKIIGAGVSYRPRKLYDIGLSVNQTYRTSDISIYSYNSTQIIFNVAIHI